MQKRTVYGARHLAAAVASTLGPGGRTVVIDPFKQAEFNNQFSAYPKPIITKDGVTVARNIDLLSDRLNNLGARLLIDAAEQANEMSGDGTTSCTVIALAILEQGKRLESVSGSRVNLSEFRRGVLDGVRIISEELDEISKPVTSVE